MFDLQRVLKLDFLKWLSNGLEIDILELVPILIILSNSPIDWRLRSLYDIFNLTETEELTKDQFFFMCEKVVLAISSTFQISFQHLRTVLSLYKKEIDFFEKKESISKSSFVTKTTAIFQKLSEFLLKESLAKVSFAYHLRTNKFPHWLVSENNIFLGKYNVHKIVSLSQHYASLDIEEAETEVRQLEKLRNKSSTLVEDAHLYYPQMMQYIYHDFDFAFRLEVTDLFKSEESMPRIFQVFVFDSQTPNTLFSSENIRNLIWRETLILQKMQGKKVKLVKDFGELNGVVYREVEEKEKITLNSVLKKLKQDPLQRIKFLLDAPADQKAELIDPKVAIKTLENAFGDFKLPFLSELQIINAALYLVNLMEPLHELNIAHTNICPETVYLMEGQIQNLAFQDLYHAVWDSKTHLSCETVPPYLKQTAATFDNSTRHPQYVSPEILAISTVLNKLVTQNMGRFDLQSQKMTDFYYQMQQKVTLRSDLFSLGAILYKLVTGSTPSLVFCKNIVEDSLLLAAPSDDTFELPKPLSQFVISNDFGFILLKLLSEDPDQRYGDLAQLKNDLLFVKSELQGVPIDVIKMIGHPFLSDLRANLQMIKDNPQEEEKRQGKRGSLLNRKPSTVNDFRGIKLNQFSLKYMGKFLKRHRNCGTLYIRGGELPIPQIQADRLQKLDLAKENLYSQDLYLLSQFLYFNTSVINIDLSGNYLTQLAPAHKRQLQKKPASRKPSSFDDGDKTEMGGQRSCLGFVHFTQALTSQAAEGRKGLVRIELSDNDLSCSPQPLQELLNFHKSSLRVVSLGNCRVSQPVNTSIFTFFFQLSSDIIRGLCNVLISAGSLQHVNFSGNTFDSEAADALSLLIKSNLSLFEIEVQGCSLMDDEALKIKEGLTFNFTVERVQVGNNKMSETLLEQLQQAVLLNSQYNKLKEKNRKFDNIAHSLIAEALKRWIGQNTYLLDKLKVRLSHPKDKLDQQIAEYMFDSEHKIDSTPLQKDYDYVPGDGKVKIEH